MICKKCGTKNADSREKCFHCGYTFTEEDRTQSDNGELLLKQEEKLAKATQNKASRVWIVIGIVAALIIALGVGGFFIVKKVLKSKQEGTPGATAIFSPDTPSLECLTNENGEPYIHGIFYGEAGDSLYFPITDKTETFTANTMELDFYTRDIFSPEERFGSTLVSCAPKVYYVRNGRQTEYQMPNVYFYVSETPFKMLESNRKSLIAGDDVTEVENEGDILVYRDSYVVKFWVEPDSEVILNNENISDQVSSFGIVEIPVSLEPDQILEYLLEVRKPYCSTKILDFRVIRVNSPNILALNTGNVSTVSSGLLEIVCSTQPGAVITSNLPILNTVNTNGMYTNFPLQLSLSDMDYGDVEILITATLPDGTSATQSFGVYFWPDEEFINSKASPLTADVLNDAKGYKNKHFSFTATIERLAGPNQFIASVMLDGTKKEIMVSAENPGEDFKIGGTYNITARFLGMPGNGYANFRGWYFHPVA